MLPGSVQRRCAQIGRHRPNPLGSITALQNRSAPVPRSSTSPISRSMPPAPAAQSIWVVSVLFKIAFLAYFPRKMAPFDTCRRSGRCQQRNWIPTFDSRSWCSAQHVLLFRVESSYRHIGARLTKKVDPARTVPDGCDRACRDELLGAPPRPNGKNSACRSFFREARFFLREGAGKGAAERGKRGPQRSHLAYFSLWRASGGNPTLV